MTRPSPPIVPQPPSETPRVATLLGVGLAGIVLAIWALIASCSPTSPAAPDSSPKVTAVAVPGSEQSAGVGLHEPLCASGAADAPVARATTVEGSS